MLFAACWNHDNFCHFTAATKILIKLIKIERAFFFLSSIHLAVITLPALHYKSIESKKNPLFFANIKCNREDISVEILIPRMLSVQPARESEMELYSRCET